MKRASVLIIGLATTIMSYCQSLRVVDFEQAGMDLTTGVQRKDLNGTICALVKVFLPIAGVKFEGNVIETRYDVNEYLVYMSTSSKFLQIKCPNYKPLRIDFSQYEDIGQLKSKATYTLTIAFESSGTDSDLLREEYESLVLKANDCFDKKRFTEARKLYGDAILPKYASYYDVDSFKWINLCDTIIEAQSKYQAVTPQLAQACRGLDDFFCKPYGFSEGMMVVDHGYGHVSLISTEGNRIELNEAIIQFPYLYKSGLLSLNINGSNCFIDKKGIQQLNYRLSGGNKYFNDLDIEFGPLSYDYSSMFNSHNGKIGLINILGHTVLPPTNKYNGLTVLKDKIILYDQKHLYCWFLPLVSRLEVDRKNIFKFMDYEGYILPNSITEDYVIISDKEAFEPKDKSYVFSFDDKNLYIVNARFVYPIDSIHVLLRKDNVTLSNGEHKSHNYTLAEYKTGKAVIDNMEYAKVVSDNLVFDGINCYDTNGKILFSLDEFATCSSSGYHDGFMLIESNKVHRYIDKSGHTLINSEFVIHDRDDYLMGWHVRPFNDGFGLIKRDGKWGLIDRFGTTTFDYQ